jgi:integrase
VSGRLPGFKYDPRTRTARFAVIIPGTKGKDRRRTSAYGVSLNEARKLWSEFHSMVLSGRGKPSTFAEYIERYGTLLLGRLSPKARKKDESRVRRVLVPFFGAVPLSDINAALVKDFVASLKTDGFSRVSADGSTERRPYAAPSINNALSILRKVLNDAKDRGVIDTYPIRGKLPRQEEPELHLQLNADEKKRFLAAFDDEAGFRKLIEDEYRIRSAQVGASSRGGKPTSEAVAYYFQRFRDSKRIFVIALETGLRKGDLLGLLWTCVAPDYIELKTEKTKKKAHIPLSQACKAALLECLMQTKTGASVFLSPEGRPFSETTFKRYFVIAKKLAGITRRFRIHDMRHSFGSTLGDEDVSLLHIQRAFGHSTPKMSLRYIHTSDESLNFAISTALDRAAMNSTVNSGGNTSALGEGPKSFDFKILPGEVRTPDPRLRRPMLLSS